MIKDKLSKGDFELERIKIEVRILFKRHSSFTVRERER